VLPADWQAHVDASALAVAPLPMASGPLAATSPSATLVRPIASGATSPAVAHPAAVKQPPVAAQNKPVAPVPVKTTALSCAQWAGLSDSEFKRVESGLVPLKLGATQLSVSRAAAAHSSKENVRYWVYYPEPANGVQALSTELKGKGFDNYIVQNEGEFHGVLSLGLFGREDIAHALIAKLKAAGYGKAAINERGGKTSQLAALHFSALSAAQFQAVAALQKRLTPGLPLKTLTCAP